MGWGEGGRGSPAAMGATAKVKLPPLPLSISPFPPLLFSLLLLVVFLMGGVADDGEEGRGRGEGEILGGP